MIAYPHIDPVIFKFGPLQVRWYGLMYVLGFVAVHFLGRYQIEKYHLKKLGEHFENLNFHLIISLILGARLGYVLFYNLPYYLQHPGHVFAIWEGGMSFHGALLGIFLGGYLYCRRHKLAYLASADIYAVTAPIGLGLGRLGNFINGELFGRTTTVPWAMVFPAGGPVQRHPSQIYEFLLEGVLLFAVLWTLRIFYHRRHWPPGSLMAAFLILYGLCRSFAEFFREPDIQLGFVLGPMTMGQVLSSLMIIAGTILLLWQRRQTHQGHDR